MLATLPMVTVPTVRGDAAYRALLTDRSAPATIAYPTLASVRAMLARDAQKPVVVEPALTKRGLVRMRHGAPVMTIVSKPDYALRREDYRAHDYGIPTPVKVGRSYFLQCQCGHLSRLLTHTSKMLCESWSLPAVESCPGVMVGKNAICGTSRKKMNCYARGGMYLWDSTIHAQWARYIWTLAAMETRTGRDAWVAVMTGAIAEATRTPDAWGLRRFRIHDSGDVFSPEYGFSLARVIRSLYFPDGGPTVLFWTPTRSYRLGHKDPAMLAALRAMQQPNSNVRPSALFIDTSVPTVPGLAAGSTVLSTVPTLPQTYRCPALAGDGTCGECKGRFICWTQPGVAVGYPLH
jgi:hypothetical protein